MSEPIPALIMTPPAGVSPAEGWVARGRAAASRDLVRLLCGCDRIGPVYVLAAEADDRQALVSLGAIAFEPPSDIFHFGHALAAFLEWSGVDRLAYFGGAAAPLLTEALLREAATRLDELRAPAAVVNNYHSTDWALIGEAQRLTGLASALPNDNPIGWVLSQDAGYAVAALPASAATRADLDTPADFLLLSGHPQVGSEMAAFLREAPAELLAMVESIRQVLRTPASTVTIIGRSSSHLWQSLERRGQIWVRLWVEERGMVASGRLARGEVRSMVGEMLDSWGAPEFIRRLATMTDAVLWDTRVWMAHRGDWPSVGDRFAADLGWAEQVADPALRDLTTAIRAAPVPILTGGHGVVSGSVFALVETFGPA